MKANLCIYIFPELVQPKMSFLQKWYFSKAVFRSENIFDITTGCMFTPFWIHDWNTLVNSPFDTCHHPPTSLVNLSTLFRITSIIIVIIIRDVRWFLAKKSVPVFYTKRFSPWIRPKAKVKIITQNDEHNSVCVQGIRSQRMMPLRFPKIWFLLNQGSTDSSIQINEGPNCPVIQGSLTLTLIASSFAIFSRFLELILTFLAFSVTNKAPSLGSNIFIKMTHDYSFKAPSIYRNPIFGGFNSSNSDDVMGKSQNYTRINETEILPCY